MNQELPITAICIVSEQNKCPSNYIPVIRTYDTNTEIDLWKDGLFGRKINRFICFTKDYPINDTFYVIEDIKLLNEKDPILSGFVPIEKCQDNNEKSFQKKVLCIKVTYRFYASTAVSDIVLVKSKRAPIGYSYLGEINGFNLCIKYAQIPSTSAPSLQGFQNQLRNSHSFSSGSPSQLQQPPPIPPRPMSSVTNHSDNSLASIEQTFVVVNSPPVPGSINGFSNNANTANMQPRNNFQAQQNTSTSHYNPLYGVPFQINPIYDSIKMNNGNNNDFLDAEKIERKFIAMSENLERYNYDFKLEKSCLSSA